MTSPSLSRSHSLPHVYYKIFDIVLERLCLQIVEFTHSLNTFKKRRSKRRKKNNINEAEEALRQRNKRLFSLLTQIVSASHVR